MSGLLRLTAYRMHLPPRCRADANLSLLHRTILRGSCDLGSQIRGGCWVRLPSGATGMSMNKFHGQGTTLTFIPRLENAARKLARQFGWLDA